MKMLTSLLTAAFVFFATAAFAQENKTVFESAGLTKATNGAPCVQLNWRTGAESTAYYLVEKSADGIKFTSVAVVFASDDTQWTAYNYRDKSITASASAVYYRIALVSEKNELTYLPAKKVGLSFAETAAVAPAAGVFSTSK
jgi:hypothetical protein